MYGPWHGPGPLCDDSGGLYQGQELLEFLFICSLTEFHFIYESFTPRVVTSETLWVRGEYTRTGRV